MEAEDREVPRVLFGGLEAGVLSSDSVRPQCEAAGPRNLYWGRMNNDQHVIFNTWDARGLVSPSEAV